VYVLENFKLAGKLKMTQALKNGSIFLVVQDLSWKFSTSKINIHFDHLFNGNKVLGELKSSTYEVKLFQ